MGFLYGMPMVMVCYGCGCGYDKDGMDLGRAGSIHSHWDGVMW